MKIKLMVIGLIINLKEKANLLGKMVILMKVILLIIINMVMEFIIIKTVMFIKDNG